MNPVYVEALSLLGPGLPDWEAAQAILEGRQAYSYEPTPPVNCGYLTPNIKRRTTLHMQVAFHAAEKSLQQSDVNPQDIELVFSSTDCDLGIADKIFSALSLPEKMVSPQNFQNVILNAAIGHLGIVLGNRASATSVTGGEFSFAVGLLHAATSVLTENHPVLYVSYDVLGPEYLDIREPGKQPFSVGMVLTPARTPRSLISFVPSLSEGNEETVMQSDALEQVRNGIGAARVLPLLESVLSAAPRTIRVPYCEKTVLNLELAPCL